MMHMTLLRNIFGLKKKKNGSVHSDDWVTVVSHESHFIYLNHA